jgi:subtilisin family serine protease
MSFPTADRIALASAIFLAAKASAWPSAIDVKLNDAFTPEIVDAIARLGAPQRVSVPPNTNFRDVVKERCGSVDPAYALAFLRENPPLTSADLDKPIGGREYLFPACAKAPLMAPKKVDRGETIGSILSSNNIPADGSVIDRERGNLSAGDQVAAPKFSCLSRLAKLRTCTLRQFATRENTNRFLDANPGVNSRKLIGGESKIKLPHDPVWSTVVLREGVSLETALKGLSTAAANSGTPSAVQVDRASVANLVSDVPIPAGSCSAAATNWPFSVNELVDALARNKRVRPANLSLRNAKILVLDTGLDDQFLVRAIPPSYLGLAMAPGVTSGAAIHSGINLTSSGTSAKPPSNLPNRLHGSEVAATLLGGPNLEPHRNSLNIPAQMVFASLAVATNDGSYLSNRAIIEALRYARRNQIPIINGSVFASDNRQAFIDALGATRTDVLFITAAGNNGEPFESDNLTWPGALGGARDSLIVTVGSHDGSGMISSFSRRGSDHVDLLAPGCDVPTFSLATDTAQNVTAVQRSGTSYSAPIVSMVASYLYAEGLNPADIKARLLISADVDWALEGVTYSSGRLKITKALAVWEDTVWYLLPPDAAGKRATAFVAGRLEYPSRSLTVCNKGLTQAALRKLSIAGDSRNTAARHKILVWQAVAGAESHVMSKDDCDYTELSGQDLAIRSSATNDLVSVPLRDVVDFIARSIE